MCDGADLGTCIMKLLYCCSTTTITAFALPCLMVCSILAFTSLLKLRYLLTGYDWFITNLCILDGQTCTRVDRLALLDFVFNFDN